MFLSKHSAHLNKMNAQYGQNTVLIGTTQRLIDERIVFKAMLISTWTELAVECN